MEAVKQDQGRAPCRHALGRAQEGDEQDLALDPEYTTYRNAPWWEQRLGGQLLLGQLPGRLPLPKAAPVTGEERAELWAVPSAPPAAEGQAAARNVSPEPQKDSTPTRAKEEQPAPSESSALPETPVVVTPLGASEESR